VLALLLWVLKAVNVQQYRYVATFPWDVRERRRLKNEDGNCGEVVERSHG